MLCLLLFLLLYFFVMFELLCDTLVVLSSVNFIYFNTKMKTNSIVDRNQVSSLDKMLMRVLFEVFLLQSVHVTVQFSDKYTTSSVTNNNGIKKIRMMWLFLWLFLMTNNGTCCYCFYLICTKCWWKRTRYI